MVRLSPTRLAAAALAGTGAVCAAQQPIGSLSAAGAQVAGLVSVSAGVATIQNNGAVTAGPHTAAIALHRGGAVDVCASSTVHLSQSNANVESAPLLVALEHGAAEMRWKAQRTDAIMTPDLRLELSEAAPLDLRIRVVNNGDTCIENAGKAAPLIHVTEQFGAGGYLIKPGQRVLFEHGSVREVVDKETSGCGCPAALPPIVVAGTAPKGTAAEANPFPEAVSAGLEPSIVPTAPPGETHAQVAATLAYNGKTDPVTLPPEPAIPPQQKISPTPAAPNRTPATAPTPEPPKTSPAPAAPMANATSAPAPGDAPAAQSGGRSPFRAIRHFLRRVFGGG